MNWWLVEGAVCELAADEPTSFINEWFDGVGLIDCIGAAHTGTTDLIWTVGANLCGLYPPLYIVLSSWLHLVALIEEITPDDDDDDDDGVAGPRSLLLIWVC